MNDEELQTIEQVKQFLEGSEALKFCGVSIEERYRWIEAVLVRFRYFQLKRVEKGVIRRYIEKVSGYSRAQVSRLIRRYNQRGQLRKSSSKRHRFPQKYTLTDIALLARTDELHDYLSGPATKKIMEREREVYGHSDFENISRISVAHLYCALSVAYAPAPGKPPSESLVQAGRCHRAEHSGKKIHDRQLASTT